VDVRRDMDKVSVDWSSSEDKVMIFNSLDNASSWFLCVLIIGKLFWLDDCESFVYNYASRRRKFLNSLIQTRVQQPRVHNI